MTPSTTKGILTSFLVLFLLACARLLSILPRFASKPQPRNRGSKTHLLIILGSGGHTAEMLYMLDLAVFGSGPSSSPGQISELDSPLLNWAGYSHRTWVVSSGDAFSALRAKEFEDKVSASLASGQDSSTKQLGTRTGTGTGTGMYTISFVPRARRIHQPLLTSPFSCLRCALACLKVLLGYDNDQGVPDLILANGPATATVLIFTAFGLRYLNVARCQSRGKLRSIYVESWARVKGLSLSGKMLCWVADRVLVQWERLAGQGGRAEYRGVLCF